ncbi:23S rRNA (adenine(2030)-N(6))-methyltransferase RlmJ [Xanthobacter tagetidis]|uniref:Ribosomal RNA large subunit methyltransferase J n=1 Tax=Xanthobacter tagetidis TaxID=60216 RepID=A0A3L7A7M2_9HYPH|nr:23S rRNA (adenine(2030)-N(6))-methyltransferase RlmJ [Xanthobacter tagetidis]MBB6307326.1 23S rRNA (adenine2030-N6)-methyltransferase [Xanthobacter tagetidis]RLP75868.1 23S rRNA (adenine(2030)-N(6))-methyltransferase RlmJ [Xanthobacter tagetidis]
MNYQHAFHAGNGADVVKHAALALILSYLNRKDAPYRVLDTHAGAGLYDLGGANAQRTKEAEDGIEKVLAADLPARAATLLAPYLDAVRTLRADGSRRYPGSPALALALGRPQDRFLFCETNREERAKLEKRVGADPRAKILPQDGWQAITAHLPPRERRGLVLVDPPFEEPGEFQRLAEGLAAAHQRFATGIVMLWYPIKDLKAVDAFRREVARARLPKTLKVEVDFAEVRRLDTLSGSGQIIVNPPFTLADDLRSVLSALAPIIARDGKGRVRVSWLTGEA